jgi:hypothetical protein
MIVNELIMPIGYQRSDKETLKKFSRNDKDPIKKRRRFHSGLINRAI